MHRVLVDSVKSFLSRLLRLPALRRELGDGPTAALNVELAIAAQVVEEALALLEVGHGRYHADQ